MLRGLSCRGLFSGEEGKGNEESYLFANYAYTGYGGCRHGQRLVITYLRRDGGGVAGFDIGESSRATTLTLAGSVSLRSIGDVEESFPGGIC